MIETTQEAIDKLAALTDIPKWLERHGYKGQRYVSTRCIMATYLRDKTGVNHAVCTADIFSLDPFGAYSVPANVETFLVAFDRGDFPSLVASDAPDAPEGTPGTPETR